MQKSAEKSELRRVQVDETCSRGLNLGQLGGGPNWAQPTWVLDP